MDQFVDEELADRDVVAVWVTAKQDVVTWRALMSPPTSRLSIVAVGGATDGQELLSAWVFPAAIRCGVGHHLDFLGHWAEDRYHGAGVAGAGGHHAQIDQAIGAAGGGGLGGVIADADGAIGRGVRASRVMVLNTTLSTVFPTPAMNRAERSRR